MDQIKYRKSADGRAPESRSKATLHPYTFAMERLSEADSQFSQHDWSKARRNYAEAANTLDRLPVNDQRVLRHCLARLSQAQIRTFDILGAVSSLLRATQVHSRHRGSVGGESDAMMKRIKAARKASMDKDDVYSPGLYVGHM